MKQEYLLGLAPVTVAMALSGVSGYYAGCHRGHKSSWGSNRGIWLTNGDYTVSMYSNYHYREEPKAGDIYVAYYDYRSNQWALDRGFPAELLEVQKVVGVTNSVAYCAALTFSITNGTEYPFPYNQWGPVSNLTDGRYSTLLKPTTFPK